RDDPHHRRRPPRRHGAPRSASRAGPDGRARGRVHRVQRGLRPRPRTPVDSPAVRRRRPREARGALGEVELCPQHARGLAGDDPAGVSAGSTPQGPVFVSVPMEFLLETLTTNPPASAGFAHAPAAHPRAIDELALVLARAASPLIVTEEVGRSVRAVEHLVSLAERLGAPVIEAWHPGYAHFPRTHRLYCGVGRS